MKETIQKLVDEMASPSRRNPLVETDVDRLAADFGLSRHTFFDEIARHIANEFMAQRMSFDHADAAANDLFAYSCHIEDPLEGFAWAVFQAFDEGEFTHSSDGPDVDPVQKYTVPQLVEVLGALDDRGVGAAE